MEFNFYKTKVFKNINEYYGMRVNFELAMIYYIVKYFNYDKILEVGFYEGLSFGAMLEAAPIRSELVAVDLQINSKLFYKNYTDELNKKKVILSEMPSDDFISDQKYNFIHIDGDHSHPQVFKDIMKVIPMLDSNGILMIDDYPMPGVDQSINELLASNTGLVPFMIGTQATWWHYPVHDASTFLDSIIETAFSSFCLTYNTEYKSHFVKKIECFPAITANNDIFQLICKKYQI